MGLLSSKLRNWKSSDGTREGLTYWCQGCNCTHSVNLKAPAGEPVWSWNGDVERPVFTPSVVTKTGHFVSSFKPGDDCWCTYKEKHPNDEHDFECQLCHTYIGCNGAAPGEVLFLGDCSHALKGTVQPFPDLPDYMQHKNT